MEKKRIRDLSFKQEHEEIINRKRFRLSPPSPEMKKKKSDFFDGLPDDLVLCILCKLSSSARSPSDFINVLLTCKRLKSLGVNRIVLSKASVRSFAVKARNWSESAHRFIKRCVDSGNVEATYTLGMIRFYCLQSRGNGASLMAKAAMNSHPLALYSLAVIQFNGSGGSKNDKDLRAGVALCTRAAYLGHINAIREVGHCLQDGYGIPQNIPEGRKFLLQANTRELATIMSSMSSYKSSCPSWNKWHQNNQKVTSLGSNSLSIEPHPANKFLVEWFSLRGVAVEGLRLCSHSGCGRPETRQHEFRRCSVCGVVNYCSRACQALDWKLRHKLECSPMEQ